MNSNYPANQILDELKKQTVLLEKLLTLQIQGEQEQSAYLSFHEFISLLKCSRSTGNRYLSKGMVIGKKVQGRVLILRRSVENLLSKSHSLSKKGDTL